MVGLSTTMFCQIGADVIYSNNFNIYPDDGYTVSGWQTTTCTYTSCYNIIIDGSRSLTQITNSNFYESSVVFNEITFTSYDSIVVSIDYKHYNSTGNTSLKLQKYENNEWITFSEVINPSNSQYFVKKLIGGINYNGEPITIRVLCTDTSPNSSSAFCIDNFIIYGYKENYCSIDSDGDGFVQMPDLLNFLQHYSYEVNCH